MQIIVTSIFVDEQEKALTFYTENLGFVKKHDVPTGEYRWIALVSPDHQTGVELLLEPNQHPAAKKYQESMYNEGIPVTMFGVKDVQKTYEKLVKQDVKFIVKPTKMEEVTLAVFDDTCGNHIQIVEQ